MSAERTPLRLAGGRPETDTIGSWMDVFETLLHVPEPAAASIREELESHLRERVRDLVIEGESEGEGVSDKVGDHRTELLECERRAPANLWKRLTVFSEKL